MGEREKSVEETVRQYESFIEDKLKVDLQRVLDHRDKLYDRVAQYYKLKNEIVVIKASDQPSLTTMIDLGCNVFVQAKIPDTKMIYVNVGYGFHVEMTLDEALEFIEKKTKQMIKDTDRLTEQGNKIKAHIKMVLTALQELQLTTDNRA
eukprot:comp80525_c0_seq1/m.48352 comp80525_c0_seq1/g.48352  ORF comp80525_c0_seq1/g.48352 comp80525_c0_seq1/m.48352 type:complete len:149 (-) comp80525_c0_seq1:207-653(-)